MTSRIDSSETPASKGDRAQHGAGARSFLEDALVWAALGSTAAVVSALVNATWGAMWAGKDLSIRDTPVIWIGWYLADAIHQPFLSRLPEVVHRSLDVGSPRGFLLFLAGGTIANLAWIVTAAVMLAVTRPIADRVLRRIPGPRDAAAGMIAAFVFTLPMTASLATHFQFVRRGPSSAIALAASAALGAAVYGFFYRVGDAAAVLRRVTIAAATMIGLVLVAAGGVALSRTSPVKRPPARPGAPNVLLVSIDSLRADRLHCYGNPRPTSPVMDSLAAQGALFENAIAPSSWTLPSQLTLLTALPPGIHGVNASNLRLAQGIPTIASVLREQGYETAGFVSALYLQRQYGFDVGFDHYDDYSAVPASPRLARSADWGDRVSRLATGWLDRWNRRGRRRPFFLFVHFWDVHYDYQPPPPFGTMFDRGYRGPVGGNMLRASTRMPDRDLRHLLALYDGEVRWTDQELGRIIAWLERTNTLDETIVVVVSDHGDEFLEHGGFTHARTLYDEVLHVPLLIRAPGRVPAGLRVPEQVRLMDVGPTILSLAGIPRRIGVFHTGGHPFWMATDLTPLLEPARAGTLAPLPAFSNLHERLFSFRTLEAKVIVDLRDGKTELYDLKNDPRERLNVWNPDDPSAIARFDELEQWRSRAMESTLAEPVHLSREQKETLRALGYIQ